MSKFNKQVIVVGSARSGTSWLSETLAQPFRYRMLFEPDQETRTKRGHLLCDQWLTSKADSPEAYSYLKSVFHNRVDCDWIAQNSNRTFKRHLWPFIPKRYIIKFVRCNLSAHYMNSEFGIPLIHIIRNPYDIIRSQEQVKFPWLYDLSKFAQQKKLVKLIQDGFNYDISSVKHLTDVEILTLRWCIENVIPLEVLKPYSVNASVVRYEDLLDNVDLFYNLCATYNLEPAVNLEKHFKQPSSKTHPNSAILKNHGEIKSLPKQTLKEINAILDIFKTTLYARRN
ncbi:hypothetical protein BXY82_2736 [Gelidibacter sediminis]|uniref:Sulfotransferase family protein n=1 Tax=Gelidibacter sediminis TaxID=1608710 RepID=A0A4R7PJ46_9FLAO|nr:sulfotransferase family protein [Gelidibacter sediminis]TDU34415.1 hypothetical protein BXY82_2736 [Gelidibacter sediminis]